MQALAEIVVALLLVGSGGVVLVAALGLWRLPDFFLRMHAPALASTLAAWIVTLASVVHFSSHGAGIKLHAWLKTPLKRHFVDRDRWPRTAQLGVLG